MYCLEEANGGLLRIGEGTPKGTWKYGGGTAVWVPAGQQAAWCRRKRGHAHAQRKGHKHKTQWWNCRQLLSREAGPATGASMELLPGRAVAACGASASTNHFQAFKLHTPRGLPWHTLLPRCFHQQRHGWDALRDQRGGGGGRLQG